MGKTTPAKPLYRTVEEALRRQILEGKLLEGDLLPSENELCAQFNTTRMTVRQALAALVHEGYIYKKKGKGSVVAERRDSLGLLSFRGFSDVVGKTAHRARTRSLKQPVVQDWPQPFFYELSEKERQAGCIFLKRLRLVDQAPVMLELTYLPNTGLDGFTEEPFVEGSLFQTLRQRYHLEISSVEQDIRAVAAKTDIATPLGLTKGEPILHIYRRYITSKPQYFIYASLFCNTQQYAIGSVIGG